MDARTRNLAAAIIALGLCLLPLARPAGASQTQWEYYPSKHCAFTIVKPQGWVVKEGYSDEPRGWAFSVADPAGLYEAVTVHGISPTGKDAAALVRVAVTEIFKSAPDVRLMPTAHMRRVGQKTVYVFEGVYTDSKHRRKHFRSVVSGGDGLMLNQRIEAPEGCLAKAAPVLLQTLANLRVAKGLYAFDEGGAMARGTPARQQVELSPRRLAGGWGTYAAPADWGQLDLGKGQVIASDPAQKVFMVVASVNFVSPRYHVTRMPGVLCADFMRPSQALAFAVEKQGHGAGFRYIGINPRADMVQQMRAGLTGARPCAAEDFLYTFTRNRQAYKGFSTAFCTGDYAGAGFTLTHFTLWAPANQFDACVPTLVRMFASYEINQKKAAEHVIAGLRRYYDGIAEVGRTVARNSEQMRRENLEIHMQRGRVQDYTSYLTTRMIMGEYDYLAGSLGYVRGDPSGLYTPDGQKITSEPYGESITRHMQEINSRRLYEAARPR